MGCGIIISGIITAAGRCGGGKEVVNMKFLKNIGKAVGEAVSFVGEKNRKAAYLNRIRAVIRCEEKAAEKEYLALGRYYYNNLRDKDNSVTEAHCTELEAIEGRLDKALSQLEQFYEAEKCACAENCACSVAVIGGEDGPTAGGEAEEITLDDVESFDHDPTTEPAEDISAAGLEAAPGAVPADTAPAGTSPAEPDENDNLPFEG